MTREGKAYLTELVASIEYPSEAFTIKLEDGKQIFSIVAKESVLGDYFAISAIYNSICEIDKEIKFAFSQTISQNIPENLSEHNPFSKQNQSEITAIYHTKNLVFRVFILWDLLAQLSNIIYRTGYQPGAIKYKTYFNNLSQGKNSIDFAKKVTAYLQQNEDNDADINPWPGNHAFLKKYRNEMTHKVSPNVTSISILGFQLRPPTMYVLHRAIEDYSVVSAFIRQLVAKCHAQYSEQNILAQISKL